MDSSPRNKKRTCISGDSPIHLKFWLTVELHKISSWVLHGTCPQAPGEVNVRQSASSLLSKPIFPGLNNKRRALLRSKQVMKQHAKKTEGSFTGSVSLRNEEVMSQYQTTCVQTAVDEIFSTPFCNLRGGSRFILWRHLALKIGRSIVGGGHNSRVIAVVKRLMQQTHMPLYQNIYPHFYTGSIGR